MSNVAVSARRLRFREIKTSKATRGDSFAVTIKHSWLISSFGFIIGIGEASDSHLRAL